MSHECSHEYVDVRTDERTGDSVTVCSKCEDTIGPVRSGQLPDRWFEHQFKPHPHYRTASQVLKGDLPPKRGERYVHICGNCNHWLGAVHDGYFDRLTAPFDKEQPLPGFIEALMESLCPKCGAANFRNSSILASLSDAKYVDKEFDITRFIANRADSRLWSGKNPKHAESNMHQFDSWHARCPCCGYAWVYGDRDFDFHHWDYDDDVGCQLCRECHQHIHRGMRAFDQTKETGTEWERDAVPRLYERATSNGLEFNDAVEFCRRFNIPKGSTAQKAASELFNELAESVPITEMMADE